MPRTVARQAPLSMGFSRQEYWSGLAFTSPGDLPSPGIEPRSPTLQEDSLPFELIEAENRLVIARTRAGWIWGVSSNGCGLSFWDE